MLAFGPTRIMYSARTGRDKEPHKTRANVSSTTYRRRLWGPRPSPSYIKRVPSAHVSLPGPSDTENRYRYNAFKPRPGSNVPKTRSPAVLINVQSQYGGRSFVHSAGRKSFPGVYVEPALPVNSPRGYRSPEKAVLHGRAKRTHFICPNARGTTTQ